MSCERKIVLEKYGPVKETRTLKNNNNKPGDKVGGYCKLYKILLIKMVWSS